MRLAPIRAYVSKKVSGKLTRWKREKRRWKKEKQKYNLNRESMTCRVRKTDKQKGTKRDREKEEKVILRIQGMIKLKIEQKKNEVHQDGQRN